MKLNLLALFVTLGAVSGVLADLHYFAWCRDYHPAESLKKGPYYTDNNEATRRACHSYKARNTGGKQWDKCPDCHVSLSGDSLVCRSNNKHIGGDEMEHYCKMHGASGSGAD
ncbi:hypothetical protein V5O48_011988 [Marasmius crinis-equi]|uniref:Uncharacterized protein n=1 Tax=Marasmius crinis-equi TaxID=585013 RepID=A0ABR3F427_9AGAR